MRRFNEKELARCNGEAGASAFIAYKGNVYDVSRNFLWKGGRHFRIHTAGSDLTHCLDLAPHGEEMLERCPVIGEFPEE